jgi:hypothetical protein
MKLLLVPIKILFLPLKYLVKILYPQSTIICYTWYSEKEYRKLLETDKTGNVIPTHAKWEEYAKTRIQFYQNLNYSILIFDIRMGDLMLWLKDSNLENTTENREKYAQYLYKINVENGFKLTDYINYQKIKKNI